MIVARLVQAGFIVTGLVLLVVVLLGIGGWVGMAISLALTMPFTALVIFGMKCPSCGVSYFFAPRTRDWNMTGVNMLKRVSGHCRNCGAAR